MIELKYRQLYARMVHKTAQKVKNDKKVNNEERLKQNGFRELTTTTNVGAKKEQIVGCQQKKSGKNQMADGSQQRIG